MRNTFQFVYRLVAAVMSRLRNVWYRILGVQMSGYILMRRVSIPGNWWNITLQQGVALDEGVVLKVSGKDRSEKLLIGSGTYINRYTIITAGQRVAIGQNCLIGPHCFIADAAHGMVADQLVQAQKTEYTPVVIEDGVWVGAGCIVLAGARLGSGCVIGAGSVVAQDVPAGTIAMSAFARVVKVRP